MKKWMNMAEVVEDHQRQRLEIDGLRERIMLNLKAAEFQKEQAFVAGFYYAGQANWENAEQAFKQWKEDVISAGIIASCKAGREP